jgi:protein O-GlcNAc transferase
MSFNPEQVYRQALSAWQNGRLVQAEKLYRKLLQHDPGHPVLLHDLGGVLLMRGVYADAADLLEQCLVRMPDHLAAHANIGVAYYHLGQPQRALLHYDWVLR